MNSTNVVRRAGAAAWSAGVVRARRSALESPSPSVGPESVRVLRYPNGEVRRIRYPNDDPNAAALAKHAKPEPVPSPEARTQQHEQQHQKQEVPTEFDVEQADDVLTPDALVRAQRMLTARRALAVESARQCYDIHDGSPWIETRRIWVLGAPPTPSAEQTDDGSDDDNEAPHTIVTFPTRVRNAAMSDSLSVALGREGVFDVSSMAEAVLVFDDESVASNFADLLSEERGGTEVSVAELDSHQLFLMVSDAGSGVKCCVIKGEAAANFLPSPELLRLALLNDDDGGSGGMGSLDDAFSN